MLSLTRNTFQRNSAHLMGGTLQSVNSSLKLMKNILQNNTDAVASAAAV